MIPGNCPCCGQAVSDMNALKKRDYVKILKSLGTIEFTQKPQERTINAIQRYRNTVAQKISGWRGLFRK